MEHEHHHEELMAEIAKLYHPMLDDSKQSIYIYLDDNHKVCNKKFASLLGYKSPEEWASSKTSFTDSFVDKSSQNALVTAFQNAMENFSGSHFDVTWKKKDGKSVKTKN